jgi:hypothetical protein
MAQKKKLKPEEKPAEETRPLTREERERACGEEINKALEKYHCVLSLNPTSVRVADGPELMVGLGYIVQAK